MKLRHLFYAAAALLPLAFACNNEQNPEDQLPLVKANPATVQFGVSAGSEVVSVEATRDWFVSSKPDWVEVTPSSGKASMSAQTVTLTVLSNSGNDREGRVVFSIGFSKAAANVSQKGEAGALTPGTGTKEDPYSVSGVLAYLNTLGNNVESPQMVYIKGVVSNVVQNYTYNVTETTYGNARFYIKDSASDKEDFYCYNTKYLGNKKFVKGQTDIEVGDNVIICGKVVNYSGTSGKVTPETVANDNYLYSLNGTVDDDTPQTEITAATVAEFIQSDGSTYYRLTGKVSAFQTGHNNSGNYDYMQFNLTDDTGTVVVYGFKDRDASYREWATKIKDGGTVVLTGTYEKYTDKNGNTKDEVMNTTIESFEEGSGQTEITDATVAEFKLTDGITYYRLTGTVSGFKITNPDRKFMQFTLTDATGDILAYGFKDGEFDKWSTKLKDNGTVTLTGTFTNYNNTTPEIMNITIESFQEGDPLPDVSGTVSDAIAAANGSAVTINDAIVSAYSTKGYFVTDGSKNVLVYKNAEPTVKIGDKLKIVASKTTFNNLPEIENVTEETVISSGNTVPYTAVKDLTSTIDSYAATESDYITATGIAEADGSYWKVTVSGATKYVSPRYLPAAYDFASLSGQQVIVTGYVVQITNTYVGIYVNSVAPADPDAKYCRVDGSKEISVKADVTEASLSIKANAAWTLTASEGATVSPASGDADATVKVTFAANTSETDAKVYTLTLQCEAASVNETITITQGKAGAAGTTTVEKVIADAGWTNGTKYTELKLDDVITATASGTDANTGKFYTNGNDWRFYQSGAAKLTISAASGHSLVSATITYNSQNTGILNYSGSAVTSGAEVSLSGTSAEFTVGNSGSATNGQARITKIVVVYQ